MRAGNIGYFHSLFRGMLHKALCGRNDMWLQRLVRPFHAPRPCRWSARLESIMYDGFLLHTLLVYAGSVPRRPSKVCYPAGCAKDMPRPQPCRLSITHLLRCQGNTWRERACFINPSVRGRKGPKNAYPSVQTLEGRLLGRPIHLFVDLSTWHVSVARPKGCLGLPTTWRRRLCCLITSAPTSTLATERRWRELCALYVDPRPCS